MKSVLPPNQILFRRQHLAEILGTTVKAVAHRLDRGDLPYVWDGRERVVLRSDLEAYLRDLERGTTGAGKVALLRAIKGGRS